MYWYCEGMVVWKTQYRIQQHATHVDHCIIWNRVIKVVYKVVMFVVVVTFHFG